MNAIIWVLLILGLVQVVAAFQGLALLIGPVWVVVVLVASLFLGLFPIVVTVGAFMGMLKVWDWPWYFAALFAAPGLLFMVPALMAGALQMFRRDEEAKAQPSTDPTPSRKYSPLEGIFIFSIAALGLYSFFSKSTPVPETAQQPAVVTQAKPTPPPSKPAPTSNVSGEPERPVQPYANQTAQNYIPQTPVNSLVSAAEQKYANLVTEMEIKGQYTCAECNDPIVRCRLDIPRKALETQSEKDTWVRFLNEANGDPQRALKPLLKEQGCD